MGTMIKFDPITNLDDLDTVEQPGPVPLDVPEWKRSVYVRGLTGTERDQWEASNTIVRPDGTRLPNSVGSRARLIIRGWCNAEGVRLFGDKEAGKVGDLNGAALERLFDKIAELSGMTASAVEDAEGNSEPDPSDGSTSD